MNPRDASYPLPSSEAGFVGGFGFATGLCGCVEASAFFFWSTVMKPSSDHELEIARAIDERASKGNLPITAIAEIAAQIPFAMSESETRFLIQYVVWRLDHPL